MNKFKIGDKVIAYDAHSGEVNKFVGYIRPIDDNFAIAKDGIMYIEDSNGRCKLRHYKQCRKLVKKKKIYCCDNPKCKQCLPFSSDEPSTIPDALLRKLDAHYSTKIAADVSCSDKENESKFKVGDWVYLHVQNAIGIVEIIGLPGEYGIGVIGQRYNDGKYDVYKEGFIRKLNIKCED